MAFETNEDLTVRFVERALEINGETSLQIAKEGLFQPPEEVIAKYQEIFRKGGLDVVLHCVEDDKNPKEFFNLFISKKH